ncbi:MAG: ParB/RepB/Spo0J family partition protein [Bacteroidales bacterium]|nr:ParB/RepB/Spo0J family partition protein [Bacteroidales bacterium]
MSKKSVLGKGLGALISDINEINRNGGGTIVPNYQEVEAPKAAEVTIQEIPLDRIVTNPYQPRTTFDQEALAELAESIRLLGLIQPITVREVGLKYQIISGERRFRASQLAGLTHIPAYIRKADDQGMLEMAIVENIQRENLDAIEIAISFQRLLEECRLTQEGLSERVGKKRSTVTNYLRLLRLPAEIQLAIRKEKVSMGHAKVLLGVEDPEQQLKLCDQVLQQDWSVRQLEAKIRKMETPDDAKAETGKSKNTLPATHEELGRRIGQYFKNPVSITRNPQGKGRITISFNNDEEVQSLLAALNDSKLS